MKLSLSAMAATLSLVAFSAAQAELTWEKTTIELHPKPGDASAVANFKYENTGKTTVNIKNVRSSCGCTVASLKKNDVAPGEKGEVTATFQIGGRTGLQQKTVTVETDDPNQPVVNLLLKADIEVPLEIQPTFVLWKSGEEPQPKKINVKVGKDVKVTKLDVTVSSADFTAKVDKAESGDHYTITVTPTDTSKTANATLTIKSDLPQPLYATAAVAPPQQPATAGVR